MRAGRAFCSVRSRYFSGTSMNTRILLYNIYQGGETRLPVIAKIVASHSPTIVGVLEANGWERQETRTQTFAADTGLPFVFVAPANTAYTLALLSTVAPQQQYRRNDAFWHTAIVSLFSLPIVGTVAVVLVHLNPKTEDERLREIAAVISLIQGFEHVIVFGDFNSLSPADPYDRAKLLIHLQERGIKKFGTGPLRFDVVQSLLDAGLVDVMQILNKPFMPTVPTRFNTDKNHAIPLRLDYFFVSPSLQPYLTDAMVVQNDFTEQGSDHYPVFVDFSFG